MIYGIRFISSFLFHSEKDPKDILSNLNIENPQLNLRSATNFVAKKDKAVWKENPSFPMKFQSGLFITTLVFSQELNDDFQLKSNYFNS